MTDALELTPDLLLSAYCQAIFPMAHDDGIYWYDPDPRAILPLDNFHIPRSLKRVLKKRSFQIRINHAFTEVMQACAKPAPDREETWISDQIIAAYTQLHQLGFAHSVEAWQDGKLVGGLYGVAVRGLFAGESMFSHVTNSSKATLVHLVQILRRQQFTLLDIQFMTPHLRRFGAIEVSSEMYRRWLAEALSVAARFVE